MSDNSDEEQKEYEARLQRRLQILRNQLEAGKLKFARDLKVIDSLKAVRFAPDGTVDLTTVDGLVRSLALVTEFMHDREELKKALPLSEIQNTYFTYLHNNFNQFYKIMLERKLTPHDAGMALSRKQSTIEEVTKNLPDFINSLEEFWDMAAEAAHAHVEDMHDTLKGVFGGDLFPSYSENIASKCGIYTDTILLPDPFMRSKRLFKLWKPEQQAYYLIKHAMNLLQYRELACADVNPPIVVILPDMSAIKEDEMKYISRLGQDDALTHASKIFGRKFQNFDELMEFASALDTIERVEAEVVDPKRVLFDTEWPGSFREKLERAIKDSHAEILQTSNPGIIVALQGVGRMIQSNELLLKARRLRGTPIIDAPTSWQYFTWKLEYDAQNVEEETKLTDLHVVRGLQSLAENEMEWLGLVPSAALIEMRKNDAIKEIRHILGRGVQELSLANPLNFHRTTDLVFDNIHAAFKEHKKKIEELKAKKLKFAGCDIGSCIVVGSLAVTSAATGQPFWGLAAVAADQLLGAPKLKDIPTSIRKLADESNKVKQSPVGMLFKYASDK